MLTTAALLLALASPAQTSKALTCCDMNAFLKDPAFLALHVSPKRVNFKIKEGIMVSFPDSNQVASKAFWVGPRAGVTSAVILVHEFWGLNDYIKKEADRLHNETGYAVLAVDLYDGKVSTDAKVAAQLMQNVDTARAAAVVRGAVTALKSGTLGVQATKIGSVGYCFGGGWSMKTAIEGGANVNACVMYYGMPTTTSEALERLKAPVLFIRATQDQWINAQVEADFKSAMAAAHKPLEVKDYDAVHAFANPSNPHYNAAAAEDAHKRELAFFHRHLG